MTILEIGALASAVLAMITLTGKIIKLITTVQSLINSIDHLKMGMSKNTKHWERTNQKYEELKQRLNLIEYELAIV